jgi:hypothetical protein
VSLLFGDGTGAFAPRVDRPAGNLPTFVAIGDLNHDGLPDLVGTGEVLWTALSNRSPGLGAPPPAEVVRVLPAKLVINEVLAANNSLPLPEDGGRKSDFVELFNASTVPLALFEWKLRLERTNSAGGLITNDYVFPTNGILDAASHLLVIYSDKVRSPLHTGFRLPAEGGSLCLIRPDGSEADRVNYPAQAAGPSSRLARR